jgi:pimeloyl-ACP methyl ester carboxylesterase
MSRGAVVLLHAGVADSTMWDEHVGPLRAAGYEVLTPEVTGDWNDVIRLMDSEGIDKAALVGNSFGGAVALRVAAVAPERVSLLVLVSAPPPDGEPSDVLKAAWEAEGRALEEGDVDAAVEAVAEAWTRPGPVRDRVRVMQRRLFETGGPEVPDQADPVEDDPSILERLDVPALVAVGEHDMVDFREAAERMAAALPRAHHVVIEGAGHLAPLETPEEFRQLLLDELALALGRS